MPSTPLTVLNIGIGNGWLERRCAGLGWTVVALDPDTVAARALAAEDISAVTGTIDHLPFADGRFDVVFCSEVLEHLDDGQLERAAAEIDRVLKDGGLLIGTVPHREDLRENLVVCPHCGLLFHRWGHQQSFDTVTLRSILETAGLAIEHLSVRAFRDYARASAFKLAKFLLRWPLARAGSTLVYANIVFAARKPAATL